MRDDYGSIGKDRRDRETKGRIQESGEGGGGGVNGKCQSLAISVKPLTTTVYEKCENLTPPELF